MGLLKRDSGKNQQEESVFGRHGKSRVSYSLETEKQEEKESPHLIDSLPLLISDISETPNAPNATPTKKKIKRRNSMKIGEAFKSPPRQGISITSPLGTRNSRFSLTPLSGSKKKVSFRKIFSSGNNAKSSNQYRQEYREAIPKLAFSGDTDNQSDSDGKIGNETLSDLTSNDFLQETSRKFNLEDSLNTRNLTLFDQTDSAPRKGNPDTQVEDSTTMFGSTEWKSSNKFESSDSLEELLTAKSSHDVETDQNQEHRQKDLIKFLSETTPVKSSNEDNCKEDAVHVLNELMSLEKSASNNDHHQKDVVNVLNELICLENSRFTSVEEGKTSVRKVDPQYGASIRSIVAKTIQDRCNNATEDSCSPWAKSGNDDCKRNSKKKGTKKTSCYDEESTVVTVKCSNRSNPVERNVTTPPKVCQYQTISCRPEESTASSTAVSSNIRNKKFQQAIKIYEDALKLKVAHFKNVQAYHSTMIVTATKLANLYIATGQSDMATKYIEASKRHRLCLDNPIVDKSSSSEGSSSSSPSSSSSSSFFSSSSSSSSACEVTSDA